MSAGTGLPASSVAGAARHGWWRLMRRALGAAAALALISPGGVGAETVVAEPSDPVVHISSNFTGELVSVFGVIAPDRQTVSRRGGYDVAITVRGPDERILVQRKDRIAGVWINASGQVFTEVPSYFAIATTRPVDQLVYGVTARQLGLGLAYVGHAGEVRGVRATREPYREALVRLRRAEGLYRSEIGGVDFLAPDFFRARFELPSSVADGRYRIDVHLFAAGARLATTTTSFDVVKVGFEQLVFGLAMDRPALYGFGVVCLALLLGYVGSLLFRRG